MPAADGSSGVSQEEKMKGLIENPVEPCSHSKSTRAWTFDASRPKPTSHKRLRRVTAFDSFHSHPWLLAPPGLNKSSPQPSRRKVEFHAHPSHDHEEQPARMNCRTARNNSPSGCIADSGCRCPADRKSTRLNSS